MRSSTAYSSYYVTPYCFKKWEQFWGPINILERGYIRKKNDFLSKNKTNCGGFIQSHLDPNIVNIIKSNELYSELLASSPQSAFVHFPLIDPIFK